MRVLFVCSGNSDYGIVSFIKSQGESLKRIGIQVDYFTIKGKGIKGYLNNVKPLRKCLKKNNYYVIHAHYVLCGWVAVLANRFKDPIIVSYMGSDTYGDYNERGHRIIKSYFNILLAKLLQPFVKKIIVKSENLKKYINFKKKINLIPNGVDIDLFQEQDNQDCKNKLNLEPQKKYILFLGDKNNQRKNFGLLKEVTKFLDSTAEIIAPYPLHPEQVPLYLNASDVFVLSSYNEGSPNVIKEAMACNCPIVATDVGDVSWVLGDTEGCYISSFGPESVAAKIKLALEFADKKGRTRGRERLKNLRLDSESVANRLIEIYKNV